MQFQPAPPVRSDAPTTQQQPDPCTVMYKDEDIHLSIDGDDDGNEKYEYDENKLQYKKGSRSNRTQNTKKTNSNSRSKSKTKKGGGDCSDWLCKKSIRYRFGYAVALAIVLALVFTTPRTTLYLPPKYNEYNTASVVAFGLVLFVMLLSYWIVQNSDPGFLTEIISPDEAVMYSSDAFRAHLMKSEWGDEDDGTWEDSVKNIMEARTKFTDEDLENAERQAEEAEREARRRNTKKNTAQKNSTTSTSSGTDEESTHVPVAAGAAAGAGDSSLTDTDPSSSSNKKIGRIHDTRYGEESEIEGLIYQEIGIPGKKIKTYRIDTKHPDLPYRAIYCKAERRWYAKYISCLALQSANTYVWCTLLSNTHLLLLFILGLLCLITIAVYLVHPSVKRTMLDFGGICVSCRRWWCCWWWWWKDPPFVLFFVLKRFIFSSI